MLLVKIRVFEFNKFNLIFTFLTLLQELNTFANHYRYHSIVRIWNLPSISRVCKWIRDSSFGEGTSFFFACLRPTRSASYFSCALEWYLVTLLDSEIFHPFKRLLAWRGNVLFLFMLTLNSICFIQSLCIEYWTICFWSCDTIMISNFNLLTCVR